MKKSMIKKAKLDRHQKRLAWRTTRDVKIEMPELPPNFKEFLGDVLCPFCLHKDKPINFAIKTRKGYNKRLAKCPKCKNGMLLESLTASMTPSQFAEWVWEYPASGFWKKCLFHTFSDRLKRLGWSYEFWDKYHALKDGGAKTEYEQYEKDMQSGLYNDS